jgi:hypothetical protein
MLALLRIRLPEVLRAVAPLLVVVCVLQFGLVHAAPALFVQFLAGATLATLGMLLLFAGVDLGILPMGRFIGAELPAKRSLSLMLGVGFALGFATTAAEPDVLVLAGEVEAISQTALTGRTLTYLMSVGVGIFVALALLRILWGFSMAWLLVAVYSLMILLSWLAPPEIVPLAYDAGSVTTGVLTAPVVLSLALGLSSVLGGRSAVEDGFGLLGLASAGAIIVVLVAGLLQA